MSAREPIAIELPGLTKADALELRDDVGQRDARLEERAIPSGAYGELATITLVVVATAKAVEAVARYLAARRGARGSVVSHTITLRYPDGSERTETLSWKVDADESPLDAVTAALEGLPGLAEVLAGGHES
ncbi:MAG: hypothetical protein ACTHOE_03190 [Conexibacter sp.]